MQVSNRAIENDGMIVAVLGPTNTGKTHNAIEQMLSYETGVIGFPLRLLARENYNKLVKMRGAHSVALITGEEKIIPRGARYFCCTVESMPVEDSFEFLAVDEIQLCADPERGHVFTDRLLRARGTEQTMFMGSDTIKPVISALVPNVQFTARERLSRLSFAGHKKLSRMPKRTAIVAFSIDDVYSIADQVRRQRGGTALVLGALSPRTRNKQVEMYQAGEVDFMVATDAIGMGLNMDVNHVALASLRKFDGHRPRYLGRAEVGQIAGRAGRYTRDGSFGVTGRVQGLDADMVEAIENHRFEPLQMVSWRNSILDYSSAAALRGSLEAPSGNKLLAKGRPSDDYMTLVQLLRRDDISARASSSAALRLLWDVCQIPDFRKTMSESHQELVAGIYANLIDREFIPDDEVNRQIKRLDKTDGDVDTLMTRIAHIRTWTYITHKSDWLRNAEEWQATARQIDDKLSDALHDGLTKRFVDKRSAGLRKAVEEGAELLAGVRANGEVVVEGHEVGHLSGFRFDPVETAGGADYKMVMTAARNALKPEIKRRIGTMLDAEYKQFRLTEDGKIMYQQDKTNPTPGVEIARVRKGQEMLRPVADVLDSDLLEGKDKAAVKDKLDTWLVEHVDTVLEPLKILANEEGMEGAAKGIAFQLHESLGILPREGLEDLIADLGEDGRQALRNRKVRMGPLLVFLPLLNKPAAVRLRALLWNLWNDKPLPAPAPADGITSFTVDTKDGPDPMFYRSVGYPVYGPRAIRVDMLDRLVCAVYDNSKDGFFQAKHEMAEWLGCPIADLYQVLEAMGHKKHSDPAEDAAKTEDVKTEAPKEDEPKAEDVKEAEVAPAAEVSAEEKTEEAKAETQPQVKPELATFRLRRGKAYGGQKDRPAQKKPFNKDKKKGKPFNKDKKGGKKPSGERPQRVISAAAKKVEDSPFAVLKDLKVKSGDK